MKSYPHIKSSSKAPHDHCFAFYKYDGSNMRAEWTRKNGFFKFGTRNRLVDETDLIFNQIPSIFMNKYAEDIERILIDNFKGITKATVFGEFKGVNSFAGNHIPEDKKDIILFDVAIHKKGILDPKTFLKLFGHLDVARLIYEGVLNQRFISWVRKQPIYTLEEGVVCKGGKGHKLWMVKIKTNDYLDLLKTNFGAEWKKYWE